MTEIIPMFMVWPWVDHSELKSSLRTIPLQNHVVFHHKQRKHCLSNIILQKVFTEGILLLFLISILKIFVLSNTKKWKLGSVGYQTFPLKMKNNKIKDLVTWKIGTAGNIYLKTTRYIPPTSVHYWALIDLRYRSSQGRLLFYSLLVWQAKISSILEFIFSL